MSPKILFASQGLSPDGGIASVSRTVAFAFNEGIKEGRIERVDHLLINDCPSDSPRPPERGEQYLQGGWKVRFSWDLWRLHRRYQHDLFVFDHLGVARIMTLPIRSISSKPYAVFVHGIELELVGRGNRFYNALRGAHRILANSQYTAERIYRAVPDIEDRVRVIPLCIEPARLAKWKKHRNDSTFLSNKPAALIVGRMCAEERGKGHDELIEAWPQVQVRVPNACLWIVGDGNDRHRYENKVRRLGLTESVEFLGYVDDEKLGELYRRVSIFVMPSRQEGFGIVYAEAMWHGLPCIASQDDAASEIIEEGKNGYLVPYGDVDAIANKIVDCLEDPKVIERMGETARTSVQQRFSYPRFKKALFDALPY